MLLMSDHGIDRRVVLGMIAAAPVVAKLDIDELTADELSVLKVCARLFKEDEMADYPTFDGDSSVITLAASLEKRGLVKLYEGYVRLPDGTTFNKHYYITDRGRQVLAKHDPTAPTSPSWSFPEGDVRWKVADWYVDPTNTQIVPPEPRS